MFLNPPCKRWPVERIVRWDLIASGFHLTALRLKEPELSMLLKVIMTIAHVYGDEL